MFLFLAVRRGAQLLDQRVPGWADRIDIQKLDIGSEYRCILGQLYGEFYAGIDALHLHGQMFTHGFAVLPRQIKTLNHRWRQAIARRRTIPQRQAA